MGLWGKAKPAYVRLVIRWGKDKSWISKLISLFHHIPSSHKRNWIFIQFHTSLYAWCNSMKIYPCVMLLGFCYCFCSADWINAILNIENSSNKLWLPFYNCILPKKKSNCKCLQLCCMKIAPFVSKYVLFKMGVLWAEIK